MRVLKKKKCFYLLITGITLALICSAGATLTDNAIDTGSTNYSETWGSGLLTGHIAWAVYDDVSLYESDSGYTAPGEGSFVYVYRIFNDSDSISPVSYFSILGIGDPEVSGQTAEGDFGGQEPFNMDVNETDGAYWEWADTVDGNFSCIQLADNSWVLVLTSDFGPVDRDFEIRGTEDDPLQGPGDDGSVPEPLTVALLGAGGALLIRKKRTA